MRGLARDGFAFGYVIPNRDDSSRKNLRKHVMKVRYVDEEPHTKLIESEPNNARPKENYRLPCRLLLRAFEDVNNTQPIVEDDCYAERNRRRVKIINARKLREHEQQRIIHKKRDAAHETESDNF